MLNEIPRVLATLEPWAGTSERLRRLRLPDDGFLLPQEAILIHIYTTSPLHFVTGTLLCDRDTCSGFYCSIS